MVELPRMPLEMCTLHLTAFREAQVSRPHSGHLPGYVGLDTAEEHRLLDHRDNLITKCQVAGWKREKTMKNAVLSLLFLALFTLMTSCTANTPETTSPTQAIHQETPTLKSENIPQGTQQDEQAIYSLFPDHSAGKVVIIREETFGDGSPQSGQDIRKSLTSNLAGISDETVNNYLLVNAASSKLPADLQLGVNYTLISTPEFVELTAKANWREIWEQKYPDAEIRCLIFSRVGFNSEHTQALIYVTKLWVEGGYYLLEKQAGKWEVIKSYSNVIIN